MTYTDLAQTRQATALAAMLETERLPRQLVPYRGVLTPLHLDAPGEETAALATGAAIHDLGWMQRVAVRGEDRFRWLSGMVTNTVNDLFPNSGAWNLVLNVQGHIQGDLMVWRGGEELSPARRKSEAPGRKTGRSPDPMEGTPFAGESELELEIDAGQFDRLLAYLNRYIVMDDVELVPLGLKPAGDTGAETAIGLTGPGADEVLERVGIEPLVQPLSAAQIEWNGLDLRVLRGYGVLGAHYEFFLPASGLQKLWSCLHTGGATRAGCAALDAFRVAEGIPLYGIDIAERDLPQETAQTRALHFNKGCYLGQEVVERIRSRGSVHRHLRPLELAGPVPAAGVAVRAETPADIPVEGAAAAGYITSAAELKLTNGSRVFALAMLRAEAEKPGLKLLYGEGPDAGSAQILSVPPTLQAEA